MINKSIFVIPCFNEGVIISSTVDQILKIGHSVVCIDDGSTDNTFRELGKIPGINLIRHPINLGQGAALETGFEWVRRNDSTFEYVITFDADGQHRLVDAIEMIDFARTEDHQIVLGSRFLNKEFGKSVPWAKRIILPLLAKFSRYRKKMKITDRHNGLRVIKSDSLSLIRLQKSDFSHADEFLEIILRNNLRFSEFPVQINYTNYSLSKGQPLSNGLVMIIDRIFKI